ncbi:hypothetical protein COU05_00010 [bacterium (Candidatus Gribaldobacteria) CG10_big_fil_rev_8_21_14_0_10_37_21]|uniref:Uncharacterized protein n=1 Tax=bacterium (Candidatus Gribaldobacteria) CG10_big_fil_rev_8_21_14_0_10_37_21 TaxID=2014275 RepID=A0A2H0UVA7_9BACT|nr:MAG: hypothetical protein COU05_00010 [bacterium (Candidatus Gribaldobacteria) CG10_big_fil_rev_8_21_14_0_10_37_21]
MEIKKVGLWWLDTETRLIFRNEDFSKEEVEAILPQVISEIENTPYLDSGHMLVELEGRKFFVYVWEKSSVELPFIFRHSEKTRTANPEAICGFRELGKW